jgi:hypothetical protein
LRRGFPIRRSTDRRLLAAPRGLSQRATSFVASRCQGIHQMPLSCLIASVLRDASLSRGAPAPRAGARRPPAAGGRRAPRRSEDAFPWRGGPRIRALARPPRGTGPPVLFYSLFTMSEIQGRPPLARARRRPVRAARPPCRGSAPCGGGSVGVVRGADRHGPAWTGAGRAGWWRRSGSNRRPHACKARALPAELRPRPRPAPPARARPRRAPVGARRRTWWAREDLNLRPHAYQARALTS